MNDYISKPIQPKQLHDVLSQWLSTKLPDRTLPTSKTETRAPEIPVFDLVDLMARIGDDQELAHEIITAYLDDEPRLFTELSEALAQGDDATLIRYTHTIKGSAATVGGKAVQAIAAEMEQAARKGDRETVQRLAPTLEQRLTAFTEALRRYQNTPNVGL
jgi:HPt (histidine-containing phosphotransfer) domain-containing protein